MIDDPSIAFDDESRPVLAQGFDYDALDRVNEQEQDLDKLRQEILLNAFRGIINKKAGTPLQTGRDAYLTLFFLNRGDFASKTELAKEMGVTPPRLSALIKRFKAKYPLIAALSDRGC